MAEWKRVPVIEPMEFRRGNVFEHTPLDYYASGEYPRFLRPLGHNQPRTKWERTLSKPVSAPAEPVDRR